MFPPNARGISCEDRHVHTDTREHLLRPALSSSEENLKAVGGKHVEVLYVRVLEGTEVLGG